MQAMHQRFQGRSRLEFPQDSSISIFTIMSGSPVSGLLCGNTSFKKKKKKSVKEIRAIFAALPENKLLDFFNLHLFLPYYV